MKIAIIGAGFAGLATAWHLLKTKPQSEITLLDAIGIGGQASGVAAGLLHPFSGLRAKLNHYGNQSFYETIELLLEAEKALQKPVFKNTGLLRLALSNSQQVDFLNTSDLHDDVDYISSEECKKIIPYLNASPGLLIKKAKTVYTDLYLEGLFLACQQIGLKYKNKNVQQLNELDAYDHIIVTAGAETKKFPELDKLRLSLVKGQILELEWPKTLKPLTISVNSQNYIVMNQSLDRCIVGATYERNFNTVLPDQELAKEKIMPQVIQMIPDLKDAKIMSCKAAIRVSTLDHLPIVEKINERLYVFVGLGSKGLLYHSYYAKKLATLL